MVSASSEGKPARDTTFTPTQVQFSSFMPPEARDFKFSRHLIIAVDGTRASEDATRWVIANMVRSGDLLHLCHVAVPQSLNFFYTGAPGTETTQWQSQYEDFVKSCVERTEKLLEKTISDVMPKATDVDEDMTPFRPPIELDCILDLSWDPIGHILIEKATKLDAACLILVRHKKRWAQKLLTGSVSDFVINEADMPVLVWHAPMPTEDDLLGIDAIDEEEKEGEKEEEKED